MQRDEAYLLDILIAARKALQFLQDTKETRFRATLGCPKPGF
jgi:hypothetical protein